MIQAEVAHHVHFRTRIEFPERKGDDAFFARLLSECQQHAKVQRVLANPRTGSLTIEHTMSLEQLKYEAAARKWFELKSKVTGDRVPRRRGTLARDVGALKAYVNDSLLRASDGTVDLATGLAITFSALAMWQIARGKIFPAASTMVLQAGLFLTRSDLEWNDE